MPSVGIMMGPRMTIRATRSIKQPAMKKMAPTSSKNVTLLVTLLVINAEIVAGICIVVTSQFRTPAVPMIIRMEPEEINAFLQASIRSLSFMVL